MTEKLSVCFVWHMHQPLYKDRTTGLYLMPWVRLHAIKDYLDMPLILEDFPKVRQTFNLVPSLLEQLADYADNGAVDQQLLLTYKDENSYTLEDKVYLLSESFHANVERQIKPHKHYYELFLKREKFLRKGLTTAALSEQFTPQELADMAAWMNLAWFDPIWIDRKPELKALIAQGSKFTLQQRQRIIEIQRELIRDTIPVYKRLQDAGQIEVTTTPYYHPILPLLIDSNVAKLPAPHVTLPASGYFHRKDAKIQLEKGLKLYKDMFGRDARGMWPSEMSVSPAALELISELGVKWVVVDEALLCKTTGAVIYRDEHGNLNNAEVLCQPYNLRVGDQDIAIFFREVVTSNEIGFSYGGRAPEEAATALYMRMKHIQQKLFHWKREGCLVIALDGENCWETYEKDGAPFLRELYERISEDNTLRVCTVEDYLQRHPPTAELRNIHSGSWINSDFHIWIGDPAKNRAWELLGETRDFLSDFLKANKVAAQTEQLAWEEIYAAEGSDWFWWFGEPNNSAHDDMFDEQFRLRLQNVYKLVGVDPPHALTVPVAQQVAAKDSAEPIAQLAR